MFRRQVEVVDLRRGFVIEVGEGRQPHRLPRPRLDPQVVRRRIARRDVPQGRRPVGRQAHAARQRRVEAPPAFGVPQPQVSRMAFRGVRVVAVRLRERLAEVRAVDVVVGVVAAKCRHAARPRAVGREPGTRVVRVVTVQRRTPRPVVAVEILAVARRGREREAPQTLQPAQRCQRRGGRLPLVGIVGGIKAVRPEGTVLIAGLKVEKARMFRLAGGPHIGVVGIEIGIVAIAVAATVRCRAEHRKAARRHGAREVGIGVAVLSARPLETQVGRAQRRRADVHRPGVGADARHAVEQLDTRHAVEVDGQRVGLVARAGVRKVNTVQEDHGLVERASPDGDVGLHALCSAFADVDRRSEAQDGFQRLDRRRGLGFPVEKRGVRLGIARGSRGTSRNADLPDPQIAIHGGRIGLLRRCLPSRKHQDRHPDGKYSDRHAAVATRKDRPALAIPTPPASRRGARLHLDVFHVFGISVKQ